MFTPAQSLMYGATAFAAVAEVATKPTPWVPHESNVTGVDVHMFGGVLDDTLLSARHSVFSIPAPMAVSNLTETPYKPSRPARHAVPKVSLPSIEASGRHLRGREARDAAPSAQAAADSAVLPGIDYLSYGYNVIKGFPLATTYDNGWSTQGGADIACESCFSENRTFYGREYRVTHLLGEHGLVLR